MIIVTGGAGFIGSALVWKLNKLGEEEIIIVDELGSDEKWKNLIGLRFIDIYHPNEFIELVTSKRNKFDFNKVPNLDKDWFDDMTKKIGINPNLMND